MKKLLQIFRWTPAHNSVGNLFIYTYVILLGSLLGACSSFERDWEAAGAAAPAPESPLPQGAWAGSWRSDVNGHSGKLRCIMKPIDSALVDARFHATWGCCFTFEYTVPLTVRPVDGNYTFVGQADLGWFAGGVYRYQGRVVGNEFESSYKSESDDGTFWMERVRSADEGVRNAE